MFDRKGDATREHATGLQRRWGPFSGTQLTLMFCTVVLVVGLPVGAFAVVSGSNAFVTDSATGVQARVDAKRNLAVAPRDASSGAYAKVDGKNNLYTTTHDPETGSAAKVDGAGEQLVTTDVSRTVNFGQIDPGSAWLQIAVAPQVLKTIHVDTYRGGNNGAIQFGVADNGCSGNPVTVIDAVDPPGLGVTELDYADGYPLVGNQALCVRNTNPAGLSAAVFMFRKIP